MFIPVGDILEMESKFLKADTVSEDGARKLRRFMADRILSIITHNIGCERILELINRRSRTH